jgi:cell filamentation protein
MPIDPYINPETGILENKIGAKTAAGLALGESRAVFLRLKDLELHPIEGRFDADHLKAIHRHLFQDVYSRAGNSRLTDMRRDEGSKPFTRAVQVDYQLQSRLLDLADADYFIGQDRAQFAANAACLLRDINSIHPFAEGNGRMQRVFMAQLAEQAGHTIRWGIDQPTPDPARKEAWNEASLIAHNEGDLGRLTSFFAASYKIPLPEIRRNPYPEPDRAEIQERIATDVEQDTFKYLDRYRALPESQGGRYVCSDLFKETFPEYAASPENRTRYNSPLHNSAAVLAAVQLESAVADSSHPERNTVIFLTGTPGAGKTSSIVQGDGLKPHIRAV